MQRYAPPADRYVRSVLLDFQMPSDAAFVDGADVVPATDPTVPGNQTLRVGDATSIRVGALLRGRPFPGPWDLIGLRVLATAADASVTATLDDAGAARGSAAASVPAGAWRTLWIETAGLAATSRPASAPATASATASANESADEALEMTLRTTGSVQIDDVELAQGRTVVADAAVAGGGRFRVERYGLSWRATLDGREIGGPLPAAPFDPAGYRVVEADAARVLWQDAAGDTACVDRFGRAIHVAAGAPVTSPPAAVDAVSGAGARLVRNAPGDRDNDGYDESRGCFTVHADGDRVDVRLVPIADAAAGPVVIDVDGVRADSGGASVYVQGEVVTDVTRVTGGDGGAGGGAGRLVIALPMRVERPLDMSIRLR